MVVFRRLIILHSRAEKVNVQDAITQCLGILTEFLTLQKQEIPDEFHQSQLAIAQAFCASLSLLRQYPQESSRFLDGYTSFRKAHNRIFTIVTPILWQRQFNRA
jgi:hypothetical protein